MCFGARGVQDLEQHIFCAGTVGNYGKVREVLKLLFAFFLYARETRNMLPSEVLCGNMFQMNVFMLTKNIVFIQTNWIQQLMSFKI